MNIKDVATKNFDDAIIEDWVREVMFILGLIQPRSTPDDAVIVEDDVSDFEEFWSLLDAFKNVVGEEKAEELATIGIKAIRTITPSRIIDPESPKIRQLTDNDCKAAEVAEKFGIRFDKSKGYEVTEDDADGVANNFGRSNGPMKLRKVFKTKNRPLGKYLAAILSKGQCIIEEERDL